MKILIPGAAGAIGRKLAARLQEPGHDVIGIDWRAWPNAPIEFHQVDVRKRAAEDVFRRVRPEVVIHMATVTSLVVSKEDERSAHQRERHAGRVRVRASLRRRTLRVRRTPHLLWRGTRLTAFSHGRRAAARVDRYPELADMAAADLYASTALWRFPELTTTVLRLCYSLGPDGHGTLAAFLMGRRVPLVFGLTRCFSSCTKTTT